METLQARLTELRNERELTQKDLADQIGVSASAIGFWENGVNEPKASYLLRIAKFFNVSTDYLVGNENEYGVIETDYIPKEEQIVLTNEERSIIKQYRELNSICKKLIKDNMKILTTTTAASEQKRKNS